MILLALTALVMSLGSADSQSASDWITGLPRKPIHVKAWPDGKKVVVCFILHVEVFIAHGINGSIELLPLGRGLEAQKAYIRWTLDLIKKGTGVLPRGWTSPSLYPNADTFTATTAEGIGYSLDGMDSDTLSRLSTKSGPLVLIPYPVVTVDMGQYPERAKEPQGMERLWYDYVTELAGEAKPIPPTRPLWLPSASIPSSSARLAAAAPCAAFSRISSSRTLSG